MKRKQLLHRLQSAWRQLHQTIQSLSNDDLVEPGVVGDWSIRDILAHVATWEDEALKALPVILKGERLPRYSNLYGGIDAFNDLTHAQKRNLTLEQVITESSTTHQRLLAYLDGVPDEAFARENRFLRRLRQDTYGHYREHTTQIQTWKQARRPNP